MIQYKNLLNQIEIKIGRLTFKKKAFPFFDKKVINFLSKLSREILKSKFSHEYPDLASFGFFCRKSNLFKLREKYISENLIVGRGTVLHICPSNVPMNFAFSLVFGLISGNINIVRLPRREFKQTQILFNIIKKILSNKKYRSLMERICLIKYENSDKISSFLSGNVNARIIWGGDETISKFKRFKTSPRCVDLYFSNRVSMAVINIEKLNKLSKNEMNNLALKFYNDSYIMDQQGCSSPQAIFWVGSRKSNSMVFFWDNLNNVIKKKYKDDLSVLNKKIYSLSAFLINSNNSYKIDKTKFKTVRVAPNKISSEIEKFQCHYGSFLETKINNLNELKKIITNKFQTLSYFGFSKGEIKNFIIKNKLIGIDRIVPIGRAFDINIIWDGYDIMNSISRKISE